MIGPGDWRGFLGHPVTWLVAPSAQLSSHRSPGLGPFRRIARNCLDFPIGIRIVRERNIHIRANAGGFKSWLEFCSPGSDFALIGLGALCFSA